MNNDKGRETNRTTQAVPWLYQHESERRTQLFLAEAGNIGHASYEELWGEALVGEAVIRRVAFCHGAFDSFDVLEERIEDEYCTDGVYAVCNWVYMALEPIHLYKNNISSL